VLARACTSHAPSSAGKPSIIRLNTVVTRREVGGLSPCHRMLFLHVFCVVSSDISEFCVTTKTGNSHLNLDKNSMCLLKSWIAREGVPQLKSQDWHIDHNHTKSLCGPARLSGSADPRKHSFENEFERLIRHTRWGPP
jgi:hypothetical protein